MMQKNVIPRLSDAAGPRGCLSRFEGNDLSTEVAPYRLTINDTPEPKVNPYDRPSQ